MPTDPKTIGLAVLAGFLPALVWLWFWLREDEERKDSRGLILFCFLLGMLAVLIVLPIEKYIQSHIVEQDWQIISWAASEEIMKYLAVVLILFRSSYIKRPIDYAIFIIASSLGFAALENTFFLLKPIALDHTTVSLLTSHLRFLGSTLLHAVSSGFIGIGIGLSFFMNKFWQKFYLIFSIFVAITLHSTFNFFIINTEGNNFLNVFGFLWVATIINMLLLEKLRRMSGEN